MPGVGVFEIEYKRNVYVDANAFIPAQSSPAVPGTSEDGSFGVNWDYMGYEPLVNSAAWCKVKMNETAQQLYIKLFYETEGLAGDVYLLFKNIFVAPDGGFGQIPQVTEVPLLDMSPNASVQSVSFVVSIAQSISDNGLLVFAVERFGTYAADTYPGVFKFLGLEIK
ncbi:MAG: hypothetical protein NW207_04835 [Cytophagales bacterium]|nr:hypothetical protein [Cytophagales bacterium]